MSADVIVDEARRIRDELVKRYGGLEGWIDHLQEIDRERVSKSQPPTAKKQPATEGSAENLRPKHGRVRQIEIVDAASNPKSNSSEH